MTRIFITAILFLFTSSFVTSQKTVSLRKQIEQLLATKNARVGVSFSGIEKQDTLTINGSSHFPLQSVFKFPIALKVLHLVDQKKLSLDQKIYIPKSDLLPDTWSPLRDKYPDGNVKIPLAEIIRFMVSESDNNACDILLRLVGGAKTVNDYIHELGIKNIAIRYNEEEMHREWNVQFSNWTTPVATTRLLKLFYDGKILSAKSYDFLWKVMCETSTGKERIKGQLPTGTLVAHKTGTSGTNAQGITAAINDIGIVRLPNGNHFVISVYVSNSKENTQTNEKIISDISKLVWDYFVSEMK
ncbi:MAG TPA: class A beta-lactamase, subclass A2 [Hanamia sp.]|jgi:beta-lactamase class A|nr:class A beta-lactamase, subclass A2 [Hanamia sp.]